jgi:hypothetical protein
MVVQGNERAQSPRDNCQTTQNACEEDNNKKPADRETELHACDLRPAESPYRPLAAIAPRAPQQYEK